MKPNVLRVTATKDLLGECPLWDAGAGHLYWIDSRLGLIHQLDPESEEMVEYRTPSPLGSIALADGGRLVLALKNSIGILACEDGAVTRLADIGVDHPAVRLNDGAVDPFGRFVVGTMHAPRAEGEAPVGGIYRVDGHGHVETLDVALGVANGPCFSPDRSTFYIADSAARVIWAYDYAEHGQSTRKRVFVDCASVGSAPDGAAIDEHGFLWSALVRAGSVARFAPDGRLDRIVELPVAHPTSVAFGGAARDRLYVTSISDSGRLNDSAEEAGGLFCIEGLGVAGLPDVRMKLA
jgi:sugar lactone lactonase YvrE